MFKDINESIVYCLKAAVDAGELSASTDVREVAGFLYSSWQGAVLQSKVELMSDPLERFKNVLFSQICMNRSKGHSASTSIPFGGVPNFLERASELLRPRQIEQCQSRHSSPKSEESTGEPRVLLRAS